MMENIHARIMYDEWKKKTKKNGTEYGQKCVIGSKMGVKPTKAY